jgi:hypothetical protein
MCHTWTIDHRPSLALFGFGLPCNLFVGTTFEPITGSDPIGPMVYLSGIGLLFETRLEGITFVCFEA